MAELHWKTAAELAGLIHKRELKPSELMDATLKRIEALNPKLNAFCAMRAEQALAEARALDGKIARGEEIGPLAGLPLGVKDLFDVAGLPTTFGSVPFKNNMPANDSVEVARLRAAGAIVVGKTNAPEFGYTNFTKNRLFGVTRNPWNTDRTPGGSSGGSAAAIAGGMIPLATGSDGGGSIRGPACYVGCFGLKPTFGRIPHDPMLDMQGWEDCSVTGPITRTVRDAAMYMDAVVGYHPADPDSLPHPGISYVATIERLPKKLRVGFHPTLGQIIQSDVQREVEKAVGAFRELGHQVSVLDETVPDTSGVWLRIGATQTYAMLYEWIHNERDRAEFGRGFLAGTVSAERLSWRHYSLAYRTRVEFNRWMQSVFERFDILLTPTQPTEAFKTPGGAPDEIEGRKVRNGLDISGLTYEFNLSGHPAATVRAGFTKSGLPCGLQIVAERHREDLVLQASYAYEQARPWNNKWPAV
jgi:aspartyl-tRNA(Asn)/glutamyl-tRNA(Gln) amidotransferase subunit A